MLVAKKDNYKETPNEVKLELYTLLGEGYKDMQEGKESSIESVKERMAKRREQYG